MEVETMSPEELKKLQEEIDTANKTIVSDEVQKQIEDAKAKAKEEAEKEFVTNQKIKELEKEKEELVKKQQEKELESARKLEELTKKVNESISSKAANANSSPFTQETPPNTSKSVVDTITEENVDDFEKASFNMLINRRSERE